jgi:uncharacterized membrane protein YhaH (DUF805 family)
VPLIQSVFCLKGYDDRSRFFALSGLSIILFIIFSALFSAYFLINVISLLLFSTIITLTTARRLRDAKLSKNWQFIPGILLLVTGAITLLLDNNTSYYLLLLPSLTSALLLTYPTKSGDIKRPYIYGYNGPIDLSIYQQNVENSLIHNQRIEPTLAGDGLETHFVPSPSAKATMDETATKVPLPDENDIGELIRKQLLTNKKLQLGLIICVSLLLLSVMLSSLLSMTADVTKAQPQTESDIAAQQRNDMNTTSLLSEKAHFLAMPDNFDLYLTPYQGILLHWQADEVDNGELWSQLTTKGDKSCQSINFNKGSDFRPLNIEVTNNIDYFASFSPLDSKALIQALALQSNFSLCGYKFSLKGSQAALGKHNSYRRFLDK